MQTDGDEAAAPAAPGTGSAPADGTVQQPAAEGAGTATAAAAGEAAKAQPPWTLRAEHLMAAAEALRKLQAEAAAQPEKQALRDVAVDQYEKQLLSEVIPPEEINVSFDDIGALEVVKNTLHEVVILPLQRPELFMRGALTKPTKGLLMFGPPGTGKTMLAKAVACESGAHFINVNMSAITSKWFGEGERLVRALFGLAHKLSPSVIFVDEIDSFLSKRGQSSNEHEALRKMKNEFMTHWDGLRTKASDRVLVLAATNRPMDLDDAVIRRMPRRIFVPLPDVAQREKILQAG
jgi:SpoVK/Ycf46/Vps4 family AAA+-type ATPase